MAWGLPGPSTQPLDSRSPIGVEDRLYGYDPSAALRVNSGGDGVSAGSCHGLRVAGAEGCGEGGDVRERVGLGLGVGVAVGATYVGRGGSGVGVAVGTGTMGLGVGVNVGVGVGQLIPLLLLPRQKQIQGDYTHLDTCEHEGQ